MADKKIEDATPDVEVTGVEKLPVSDNGVAKCMTVAQVKDFVLAQIAALQAAGAVNVAEDGVYLLKDGVLKPVDAATLAAAVLDYGFGKAAVATIDGAEVLGVKDSTEQKTITVTQLKAWLQDNMTVTASIDIGALPSAGTLSSGEAFVVEQSAANKKLVLSDLTAYVHGKFKDYLASLTETATLTSTDVIYVVNGSVAKKCTVSKLMEFIGSGDVIAPATHTAGNIPAWDNTAKKLTSGYGVATQIASSPSASKIPTESAVGDALAAKVDAVTGKGLSTNDYTDAEKNKVAALTAGAVAAWSSSRTYAVGDYCLYGGFLRRCVHAGQSSTFDDTYWNYVPAYPHGGSQTKFLREDGTWAVPPTATDFVGATSEADGKAGLVPAPETTERGLFLKGDGSWGDPADSCAYAPVEQTYGSIPQWTQVGRLLSSGISCRPQTASDSVTDLTDEQALECVPTVKGVRQEIAARTPPIFASMAGFAKADAKTLTGATENLSNRTVHLFNIATGGSYALALPAAVDGRSRELYVAFSQSGTQGATSTVSLTSATQIHARNGIVTSLSLTKDVAGDSQAYHVYHFFEDASQIWCVNEFAAAEGGGGGEMAIAATTAMSTQTATQLSNNTSHRFTITGGSNYTVIVPSAVSGKMREFYVSFYITGGSASAKDCKISFTTNGTTLTSVLYKGEGVNEITVSMLDCEYPENRTFHFFENANGLICEEECVPVDGFPDLGKKTIEVLEASEDAPYIVIQPNSIVHTRIDANSPQSLTLMNMLDEAGGEEGYYDGVLAISIDEGVSVPTGISLPEGSVTVLVLPTGVSSFKDLLASGKTTWIKFTMMYIGGDDAQSAVHTHIILNKIGESAPTAFPD